MSWIFTSKINKKQIFINKKRIILVFTKPKFKTQLHIGFSAKKNKHKLCS
jgi:hypothetical protein